MPVLNNDFKAVSCNSNTLLVPFQMLSITLSCLLEQDDRPLMLQYQVQSLLMLLELESLEAMTLHSGLGSGTYSFEDS